MKAREHRVKHGKPKGRSAHWLTKAKDLARELGLNVDGLLDLHDHLADLLEWQGASRSDAEWYAWEQAVDVFRSRRVA